MEFFKNGTLEGKKKISVIWQSTVPMKTVHEPIKLNL